jgi:hypothetical protein
MVQAHAQQLLNQKEAEDAAQHPLYAATKRLVSALARLERNLQQQAESHERDSGQQEQLVFFERENEGLRQERENLNTAISELQSQYADLHQVASAIYGKLEDSIKRLTKIIEE